MVRRRESGRRGRKMRQLHYKKLKYIIEEEALENLRIKQKRLLGINTSLLKRKRGRKKQVKLKENKPVRGQAGQLALIVHLVETGTPLVIAKKIARRKIL